MSEKMILIISTIVGAICTAVASLITVVGPEYAIYVVPIAGAVNECVNVILKAVSSGLTKSVFWSTVCGAVITFVNANISVFAPDIAPVFIAVSGSVNEIINIMLETLLPAPYAFRA